MKHNNRSIPKKYLIQLGLTRITNAENNRVWLFKGKQYNSLKEVVDSLKTKIEEKKED